jgi:hypothetical protein
MPTNSDLPYGMPAGPHAAQAASWATVLLWQVHGYASWPVLDPIEEFYTVERRYSPGQMYDVESEALSENVSLSSTGNSVNVQQVPKCFIVIHVIVAS